MSDLPEIPRPKLFEPMTRQMEKLGPDPMGPLLGMLGSILPGAGEMVERIGAAGAAALAKIDAAADLLAHAVDLVERIASDVRAIRVAIEERREAP